MTLLDEPLESFLRDLPAAAVVADRRGVIVFANARFAELFGYMPSEPAGMRLRAFIPGHARTVAEGDAAGDARTGAWERVQALRRDGTPLAVEVSTAPVQAGRRRYTTSIIRERPAESVGAALGAVAQGLTSFGGLQFFQGLVSRLALRLGVQYALVGELLPGTNRISTLAVWSGGVFVDNFEYELAGTPYEEIVSRGLCAYERDVQRHFPDDPALRELKAEGFLGALLPGSGGSRVGVLAVADTRPLEPSSEVCALVALLAGRAGAAVEYRRQFESLRLQSRLLDAAGQGIVAVDAQGRITHWNRACESLFGWKSSEVTGEHVLALLPSQVTGRYADDFARILLGTESWSGEFTLPRRDGSELQGYATVAPLRGAHGGVDGIVAVTTDIRDLRAARAAVEEEHRLLTSVIESTADPVFAKDREGRYILANSAFANITGMPVSELLGRSAADLIDADDAGRSDAVDREVMEKGTISRVEARLVLQGRERWVLSTKAPLRDGRGELQGVVGVSRDITRAKVAEQALRDSEEMSRDVINSLIAHIAVIDSAGEIVAVNDAWRRFGAANGAGPRTIDGVGLNYLEVCRHAASDGTGTAAEVLRGLEDVIAGKSTGFRLEYDCHSPAEACWFVMWATPLASGRRGVLVAHLDITAQRRTEEMAARLRAAEESERFRQDLLRTVSHELRTPLSVIHGYLSTLLAYEDRVDAGDAHDMIGEADAAARRLDELIENVLTMSRLDYGMLVLDMRSLALDELLHGAVAAARPFTRDRRVNVTLPAEPVLVTADLIWIRQTLLNLLDNARKYSGPEAPIEVRAEILDDERVAVSVCDHGPGVPAEKLAAIFEPFVRNRDGGEGPAQGLGLGLAICRGIIAMHGGHISGGAADGGGLCVTFTLKRAGRDAGDAGSGAIDPGRTPGRA
ncbi:MAG: PAS domain S-box protein [Chloroflexi bacterium]|nr:PAS domain S-box protein [Chloroflexota bacterium]